MGFQLIRSLESDVSEIMTIIRSAQAHFKAQGINQWQNGYPNENSILIDIQNGHSYVLKEGEVIVGTLALIFGIERTYEKIFEGQWHNDDPYAVIHRVAVSPFYKGKGLAYELMKQAEHLCLEQGVKTIRVDTHEMNEPMKGLLKKLEYDYCGIIYLLDGQKRIAYNKILQN